MFTKNKCVIGATTVYTLGNCDVKHLDLTIPRFSSNHLYTPDGTVIIECGKNKWNLTEAQSRGIDVGSKVAKLPSDDEIIQWGKDLLGL